MSARPTLLHLCANLVPGGCSRVMENLARLGASGEFRHAVAGLLGSRQFVDVLRARNVEACLLGEGLERLPKALDGAERFSVCLHRSGSREPAWDASLPELRGAGAMVVIERNIFGYVDEGPAGRDLDLVCCNSLHTLWRHWTASGRPELDGYLRRHRALYNAVLLDAPDSELAAAGARLRHSLDMPANAFVIGDVCRPDPRKLDIMIPAMMSRLLRAIPELHFLARRFPESAAAPLERSAKGRFVNLAMTSDQAELTATYGALDVLVHMSTMGESFGMAVAEAMRCGLPVIANETTGAKCNNAQRELVLDGETGFLANDPLTVLRRLEALQRSPEARKRMGAAGRARFAAGPLAPETVISQLEGEVRRLAGEKGWEIPGAGGPLEPQPGPAAMREYLSSYRPAPSAPVEKGGAADALWRASVNARRVLWKLRRKLL